MLITEHPGLWQHFVNRADNRGLTTEQQRQKYLKEQLLFEQFMSFQIQQRIIQQNISAGGTPGPAPVPTSNCIQFVVNTTFDTFFEFTVSSVTNEFTYTIEWGDGESEEGSSGEGFASLSHTYPDSDTEYTARMCFNDASIINNLNFPGFD